MAYKTQAVLHIKLYERVRTAAEREEQREAVMAFVRKAMDKNAKDSGLYKLMMLFASEKEKPVVVKDCLNKILEDPMIIARGDIAFLRAAGGICPTMGTRPTVDRQGKGVVQV